MSTQLQSQDWARYTLTRYYGGEVLGTCIQVTGPNCDREIGYIGLTRQEARALAHDLLDFACHNETPLDEDDS